MAEKTLHLLQLTNRCSFSLYAVNGKARRVANKQPLITDTGKLDNSRTHYFLDTSVAWLGPIQLIDVDCALAGNAQANTGTLADETSADQ